MEIAGIDKQHTQHKITFRKKLAMKRICLLLFMSCLFLPSYAQMTTAMEARLQFVLDSMCSKYNMKGASAAVLIPDLGVWKGAYGESHAGVPITTQMQLGIGSNTKTFIATLLLKMQEQGKLDLDDTIGTWIQNRPNINGQITIRQCLSHRSGIYNFTNHPDYTPTLFNDFTKVWQPEDVFPFISSPSFAPGTNYEYSNSNYLVAGLIIKAVYGQPLSTVLRNELLQPQQLNETVFFPEESISTSIPHVWSDHFLQPYLEDITVDYGYSHNAMFSLAWAAGAIMSTAADNVKFWDRLMSGAIINNTSLNEMEDFQQIPGSVKSYGLGLFRTPGFNGNTTIFNHGGTNIGFINENIFDPNNGICISVLTNQDSVSNAIIQQRIIGALHKVALFPVAIKDVAIGVADVSIYPNPANESIQVTYAGSSDVRLQIVNLAGQQVVDAPMQRGKHTVSIKHLPAGAYMVYARSGKARRYVQQLIVY